MLDKIPFFVMGIILISIFAGVVFLVSEPREDSVLFSGSEISGRTFENVESAGSFENYESFDDELDFDSRAEHVVDSGWFNDIDRYNVYVENSGRGRYFKVVFYFENSFGDVSSYAVTKYVGVDEEIKFQYTDVTADRQEHAAWDYEVL